MILILGENDRIVEFDFVTPKERMDTLRNAVWIEDAFDLSQVEYQEGKGAVYYYENGAVSVKFEELEPIPPDPAPEPTQLDRIEGVQLTMMEAMADQYEESQERELTNMDVLATMYEEILSIKGEV